MNRLSSARFPHRFSDSWRPNPRTGRKPQARYARKRRGVAALARWRRLPRATAVSLSMISRLLRDRASCVAGHYCIRSRPRLTAPKPTERFLFKPQSQQKTGLWQQLPCNIAALNSRRDRVTTTQSLKLAARKIFEACMGQTEVEGGRSQTACREAAEQLGPGIQR